ncbi:MAG: AraC family transcriptional regulator, partial [Psychrobacter celer]
MLDEVNENTELVMSLQESITSYYPESMDEFVGNISLLLPLIDNFTKIVFFVKDEQARYQLANRTLL